MIGFLYAIAWGAAMGLGRRLHGAAWTEEKLGIGPAHLRFIFLATPAYLLCLPTVGWLWGAVVGALVFAGSTLPQRGQALVHWYDPLYLWARAFAVAGLVAPALWWLGSPLWWFPLPIALFSPSFYAIALIHGEDGVGEIGSYALFGGAIGFALWVIP